MENRHQLEGTEKGEWYRQQGRNLCCCDKANGFG
uniref:Uncharacterized protein n=1 Tax=Arundo donax TaxID=35708 RepID=A0A0A9FGU8_ARUDO